MHLNQEKAARIRNTLRFRPKGMTISEISRKTGMNRNSAAKYLDILLISGQVAMEEIGSAKVYTLSHRVPISAFMDFTNDGILILNTDLQIIQVNEQFLRLTDAGKEDVLDRSPGEIGTQVPVLSAICDILAEGADHEVTVDDIPVSDGDELRYYRAKLVPTVFEDGQHGVTVILEDTTRQTKIRTVEALLACIVDSSDDAIIGEHLNGSIASWNAGACRLYGYSAEEAIGRSISFLFPAEREEELFYLRNRVHRGERVEHFETIRIAKDGRAIDVSVTLSPILDPHGEIIGVSTITWDIGGWNSDPPGER
jgi:PAS domain S-box-containing protein